MKVKKYTFLNKIHDSLLDEIFNTLTEKTQDIENNGGKVICFSHSITNHTGVSQEVFKGSLIISYQQEK
jgi:hypothetical protein